MSKADTIIERLDRLIALLERAFPEAAQAVEDAEELAPWVCPECGTSGEGNPNHIPMYCDHCVTPQPVGRGKWVEVTWPDAEEG